MFDLLYGPAGTKLWTSKKRTLRRRWRWTATRNFSPCANSQMQIVRIRVFIRLRVERESWPGASHIQIVSIRDLQQSKTTSSCRNIHLAHGVWQFKNLRYQRIACVDADSSLRVLVLFDADLYIVRSRRNSIGEFRQCLQANDCVLRRLKAAFFISLIQKPFQCRQSVFDQTGLEQRQHSVRSDFYVDWIRFAVPNISGVFFWNRIFPPFHFVLSLRSNVERLQNVVAWIVTGQLQCIWCDCHWINIFGTFQIACDVIDGLVYDISMRWHSRLKKIRTVHWKWDQNTNRIILLCLSGKQLQRMTSVQYSVQRHRLACSTKWFRQLRRSFRRQTVDRSAT